jgi:heme/copper-type cytochrome/quinol oxidase subunit 1
LSRLGLGQRVILVIGLGVALALVGEYITSAGGAVTGWTGYAPLSVSSSPFLVPGGQHAWLRLVIWLVLVAVWVAGSLPLMRSQPRGMAGTPDVAESKGTPASSA